MPCRVLIKARDDARPIESRHERGMVVAVLPWGHVFGAGETLPDFVVIDLDYPQATVQRVQELLCGVDEEQDGVSEDGAPIMRPVRRRLWKFMVDTMPAAARQKFAGDGLMVIGPEGDYTWPQVRNYIKNRRTTLALSEDL